MSTWCTRPFLLMLMVLERLPDQITDVAITIYSAARYFSLTHYHVQEQSPGRWLYAAR